MENRVLIWNRHMVEYVYLQSVIKTTNNLKMKILFILVTKDGHVGDLYYDWQFPFVPREGEHVHIGGMMDYGRFSVSKDDRIESKVDDVEKYITGFSWKVTGITWINNKDYSAAISVSGE